MTALALVLAGCGPKEAGLFVTVTGAVTGIATLHVVVTAGDTSRVEETDFSAPSGEGTIDLPVTLSLLLEAPRRRVREGALTGPFTVCVTARDSGNADVATACATAGVEPDSLTEYTIDLGGAPKLCGNGSIDASEDCDGTDLGGADCSSLGLGTGTLACMGNCVYDVTSCAGLPLPTVPVQRRPMNGSYVGSVHVPGTLVPLFAWDASTVIGGGAISYELDYGTEPTFAAVTAETTSFTSHQPTNDLAVSLTAPVGARYYWRVRACAAGACSNHSPTWYVNVGRDPHDLNGDGYGDLAIGAPTSDVPTSNVGSVTIFFGGPGSAFDATPDAMLTGAAMLDDFGRAIASADVNGDGFVDVVVGVNGDDAGGAEAGAVYVFYGDAGSSFDSGADVAIIGSVPGERLGEAVSAGGDVNGDGYADVLVGAWRNDDVATDAGAAFLYFGGPALDGTADATIYGGGMGDQFGKAVALPGDLNGDGFGDIAIGSPGNDAAGLQAGRVTVFYGAAAAPLDLVPDGSLNGEAAGDGFGSRLEGTGDLNGDSFADLVVGAPIHDADRGRAYVFLGGATFDPVVDGTLSGTGAADQFGFSVAAAGDVNGDGLGDLLVGAIFNDAGGMNAGRAYLFFGTLGMSLDPVPDLTLTGAAANDTFGGAARGRGDLNGDGLADFAVAGGGVVYVYLTMPLDGSPEAVLPGSSVGDGFGASIQ